jgi:hypothetical protein
MTVVRRLCVVCDLENLKNEEAMTSVGRSATGKKIEVYLNLLAPEFYI